MNKRFKCTGLTLATVLLAYALYAVAAVPLIEPQRSAKAPVPRSTRTAKARSLASLFPPGSWELGRPKILDTEQGMLLFDDYKPLKDPRKMRLNRCSLVRYVSTGDSAKNANSSRAGVDKGRPIVLRALSGADLTFDQPLNIPRGQFGDLVSGRLNGEVTIYSPASDLNSDDAFSLTTKNVQIDAHRIWTPHDVAFTYGPNSGSGRDLSIEWSELDLERGVSEKEGDGASLGHLRSLELVHLHKLEFNLPGGDLLAVGKSDTDNPQSPNAGDSAIASDTTSPSTPVEVTCDGPCRIHFLDRVASLSDNVRLNRHVADGQSDELLCDLLEIHFGNNSDQASDTQREAHDPPVPSLQLRRMVAVGFPVIVRVPSRAAEARAGRLEYDFIERRIWLEEKKKVELRDGRYRVEAKELEYAMGEDGRLGRLWARGPGHLWGEKDGRDFEATWSKEIRLRPHGENQVLSLKGAAHAILAETGQFSAEEVHIYYWEVPKADDPKKMDLVPYGMKATGQVVVDSPQFSARVREANLWFRAPDPNALPANQNAAGTAGAGPVPKKSGTSETSFERIDLVADLLHAQLIRGETMQVERLNVQGGIDFQQVQEPGQPPLIIRGESFELENAHTDHSQGVLVGRPASISAQGMQMVGPTFHLLRGENLLEIKGPGNLTLPPQETTGVPLPPFQVSWEGGMRFDGRHAHFHQRISTQGSHRSENGDVLDMVGSAETLVVTLDQYIDFNDPHVDRDVGVREFRFDQDVKFESQLYDPSGIRELFQQMEVPHLVVNQQTGQLTAEGPGWVRGVHPRNQFPLRNTARGRPTPDGNPLDFIRVDFANRMTGLLGNRQLEFGDHVSSIYGPVERWDQTIDPYQPQRWNDETFTLTCRRLTVADMGATSGELKNVVLEANGNAFVKGRAFSAQGQRISYTRIKDQLVLEGDGRNDAVLGYQPQPGSTPAELKGGKILFWPGTRQFEMNDVRSLDLRDLSQLKNGRKRGRSSFSR
ncbi:MAG: hypothetical protein ACC628_19640 [Pirellulaceae bacterium]